MTRSRGYHPKWHRYLMSFTLMFKNGTQRMSDRQKSQRRADESCHSHNMTRRRSDHPKGRHCLMSFTLMYKNGTQRRSRKQSTRRRSKAHSHSHSATQARGDHPKGRHRLMSFTLILISLRRRATSAQRRLILVIWGSRLPPNPLTPKAQAFHKKGTQRRPS